eukprot:jgi/Chlat1/1664/Chrsp127S01954
MGGIAAAAFGVLRIGCKRLSLGALSHGSWRAMRASAGGVQAEDVGGTEGTHSNGEQDDDEVPTTSGRGPRNQLEAASRNWLGTIELPVALEQAIERAVVGLSSRQLRQEAQQLSAALRVPDVENASARTPVQSSDPTVQAALEAYAAGIRARNGGSGLMEADFIPTGGSSAPSRTKRGSKRKKKEFADKRRRYDDTESMAYVAARVPATYASTHRVLEEVARRLPQFQPKKVLDFGSGPGTVWPRGMQKTVAVDSSQAMNVISSKLLEGTRMARSLRRVKQLTVLHGPTQHNCYDLVVASYALGESKSEQERNALVRSLWQRSSQLLVIVEPGTPEGSAVVRKARALILKNSEKAQRRAKQLANSGVDDTTVVDNSHFAHVVAPCPHDGVCPMDGSSQWCHFSQRLQRTRLQRITKATSPSAALPYENEKYSYVVLAKGLRQGAAEPDLRELLVPYADDTDDTGAGDAADEAISKENDAPNTSAQSNPIAIAAAAAWPRVVREPQKRGRHVVIDLCTAEAQGTLRRATATKSKLDAEYGPHAYRMARQLRWGDLWPYET